MTRLALLAALLSLSGCSLPIWLAAGLAVTAQAVGIADQGRDLVRGTIADLHPHAGRCSGQETALFVAAMRDAHSEGERDMLVRTWVADWRGCGGEP